MEKINFNEIDIQNIPYDDIDKELIDLIKLLNTLPHFKTISCCCGHGKTNCRIWLVSDDLISIKNFCFNYLNPFYNWHFEIENNINRNQNYLTLCLTSYNKEYNEVCNEINQLVNTIRKTL